MLDHVTKLVGFGEADCRFCHRTDSTKNLRWVCGCRDGNGWAHARCIKPYIVAATCSTCKFRYWGAPDDKVFNNERVIAGIALIVVTQIGTIVMAGVMFLVMAAMRQVSDEVFDKTVRYSMVAIITLCLLIIVGMSIFIKIEHEFDKRHAGKHAVVRPAHAAEDAV